MIRVYRLALATVLISLALIVLGGVARLQPAGSGCGNDWPRCNGSWLPSLGWAPIIEYAHRGAALAAVLLMVATALAAFRAHDVSRRVRISAAAGVGTIVLQSAIGGMPFCLGGVFIAAAGYLPPMAGGIPQEVSDMAVALKALWLRFHQVGLPIS